MVTNEVQKRGKPSGGSVAGDETKVRRLSCVNFRKEKVKWGRCFKEGARWSSEVTTTRRGKKPKDSRATFVVRLVYAWADLQVPALVALALLCCEPSSVHLSNPVTALSLYCATNVTCFFFHSISVFSLKFCLLLTLSVEKFSQLSKTASEALVCSP